MSKLILIYKIIFFVHQHDSNALNLRISRTKLEATFNYFYHMFFCYIIIVEKHVNSQSLLSKSFKWRKVTSIAIWQNWHTRNHFVFRSKFDIKYTNHRSKFIKENRTIYFSNCDQDFRLKWNKFRFIARKK